MTEDKQVQMKREEYVGADVVLEDVIPKTATDAVQDPTNGNNLAETLDAIWSAINNKLSRIVNSVNGRTGVVILTAADVGLENVDNVSTDDLKSWVINLVAEQFHNKHLILANTLADIDNIRDTGDTKYDGVSFVASHLTDNPDDHTMVIGYFFTDNNNSLTYDYRTFDLDDEYGVGKFYYAPDHVTILGEYFNDYENNIAAGTFSHVEGSRNRTTGAYSHLEGCQNVNTGASVHMGGSGNQNGGNNVQLFGDNNVNGSDWTFIHGRANVADEYGDEAFIVGNGNHVSIPKSFVFGTDNRVVEDNNMQIGLNNEIIKSNKLNFIVGDENYADGNMANIIGIGNRIHDDYCTIIGGYNSAIETNESTIIGDANYILRGDNVTVFGIGNTAKYAPHQSLIMGSQCATSLAENRTFGTNTNTIGQRAVNFGHGIDMKWVFEYSLLTEQPSDWESDPDNYFEKMGLEYVRLPVGEAPQFALDTYYRSDWVDIPVRGGTSGSIHSCEPFPGDTRFEEIIPLYENRYGRFNHNPSWSIAYGAGSVLFGNFNIAGGLDDFVEGFHNITYGIEQDYGSDEHAHDANHVEGEHNELRWKVVSYDELQSIPSNWYNRFDTYYEKDQNDNYTHITGETAPAWEAGKYYDSWNIVVCNATHVEGTSNIVTSLNASHVEGSNNTISHLTASHIEGTGNNPYVDTSLIPSGRVGSSVTNVHIEGCGNLINEHELDATVQSYSHTEGFYNVYAGTAAHVQNIKNSADDYGTAMGAYNRATPFATVVGFSNKVTEPTVKPVTIIWWTGDFMELADKKYRSNKFMIVTDNIDQSYEFISPFDATHATVSITYWTASHQISTVSGLDGGQIFKSIDNSPNRWRVKRSALEGLTDSPIDPTTDLDDPMIIILMEITYNESIGDHLFEVGNGGFADEALRTDCNANAFAVGVEGHAYVQNDVRLHYEHNGTFVPVSLQKLIKKLLDDGVISIEDIRTTEFK